VNLSLSSSLPYRFPERDFIPFSNKTSHGPGFFFDVDSLFSGSFIVGLILKFGWDIGEFSGRILVANLGKPEGVFCVCACAFGWLFKEIGVKVNFGTWSGVVSGGRIAAGVKAVEGVIVKEEFGVANGLGTLFCIGVCWTGKLVDGLTEIEAMGLNEKFVFWVDAVDTENALLGGRATNGEAVWNGLFILWRRKIRKVVGAVFVLLLKNLKLLI